jgi:hypothetical protein
MHTQRLELHNTAVRCLISLPSSSASAKALPEASNSGRRRARGCCHHHHLLLLLLQGICVAVAIVESFAWAHQACRLEATLPLCCLASQALCSQLSECNGLCCVLIHCRLGCC